MGEALEPAVRNVKGVEMPAGPQDASNFRERAILRFAGGQVMQHQHRDDRGKSFTGERQHRGITLHDMDAVDDMSTLRDPGVLHVTGTLYGMGPLDAAALN